MAKVIPVARHFLGKHPRKGEPTYFVEQILNALDIDYRKSQFFFDLIKLNKHNEKIRDYMLFEFCTSLNHECTDKKLHTVRNGHRWQKRELASLRIWSEDPYNSPQIIFAPDQKLEEVYDLSITKHSSVFSIQADNKLFTQLSLDQEKKLAKNDGLSHEDMKRWFIPNFATFEGMNGQILCWKDPKY